MEIFRYNLILFYWIFYNPIIECFITLGKCKSNIVVYGNFNCFGGLHIFLIIIGIIMLLLTFGLALCVVLFNQSIESSDKDSLLK